MTEQVPSPDPEGATPEEHEGVDAEPSTTGVPEVDRVLADLDRLDNAPLEEHLAAFERAHESLRSALDARPDDQPGRTGRPD